MKKSNFELLRIISILMITLHHITFTLGIESSNMFIRLWGQFFFIGGKVGVNCFVLISGYFLCNRVFKWDKIVRTHTKVSIYCLIGIAVGALMGTLNIWNILKSVFPVIFGTYWYVSAYIGMLCFMPVLNSIIQKANLKQLSIIIVICLALFTIIPTFTAQTEFNSNLVWFMFMYILGAYFRTYHTKIKDFLSQKWVVPTVWVLIWFASVIFTIGERWFPGLREGTNFFTGMYILPQLVNSVSLFLIFEKMELSNEWINLLGRHTFAGYLIQSNLVLSVFLSDIYLKIFSLFPNILYPAVVIILGLFVCGGSVIIDIPIEKIQEGEAIRRIENWISNKIDKMFDRCCQFFIN